MSKILVIGDVIEDVIVIPETEIRANTDTKAEVHKTMGGQAANVASWLSYVGVQTRFVGCVGIGDVKKLEQELAQHGIETALQSSIKSTGSLVVLVQGENRSMLTDRGANQDLNLDLVDPAGFAVVYLSGYSLLGRSLDELEVFATRVKSAGALFVIDPGSYGFIQDHGVEAFRELMLLADIVLPNQEEEQLLGLSGKARLAVVTSGSNGATAQFATGEKLEIPGQNVQLTDPTGAGDAFCAGFLGRLAVEPGFSSLDPEAVQLALQSGVSTGSKAVQQVGARPRGKTL